MKVVKCTFNNASHFSTINYGPLSRSVYMTNDVYCRQIMSMYYFSTTKYYNHDNIDIILAHTKCISYLTTLKYIQAITLAIHNYI